MHIDYHIPILTLTPTNDELIWAENHLIPQALVALEKIYERYGPKFDKADLDQAVFKNFPLATRVKTHLSELGLSLRRFAIFVGYQGAINARPHVDAHAVNIPMIARLNIPLRGQAGAKLSWWTTGANDIRMKSRIFDQWDAHQQKMRQSFSYLSPPEYDWGTPVHIEQNPGPCWNRVELAHQLDLDNTIEHRVNFTAELSTQILWEELVDRLRLLGYIT